MAREKGKSIKENDLIMLTVISQTVKNLKLKKRRNHFKMGASWMCNGTSGSKADPAASISCHTLAIDRQVDGALFTCSKLRICSVGLDWWDLLCGTWWDSTKSHQSSVLRALLKRILKFKDRLKDTS